MRRVASCVAAALLTATVAACGRPASPAPATAPVSTVVTANGRIERVVDGDTIVVAFGDQHETVRLIGIDTPETVRPDTPVECFGPEASATTAELLAPGTPVRVERDVEARDDYGRLLGYVHRATDGLFVNLELVRRGVATPLPYEPNTLHAAAFAAAATAAADGGAGLWSACR